MNDKELIEELREYATALRASVHVPHTGADLIERGADALAARQPTEGDREALRIAVGRVVRDVMNFPQAVQTRLLGQDMSPLRDALVDSVADAGFSRAAVPDAATEELRADEAIELVLKRPGMYGLVPKDEHRHMKAERDAALAAVERCRALVDRAQTFGADEFGAFKRELLAALGGASEPKWEYQCRRSAPWDWRACDADPKLCPEGSERRRRVVAAPGTPVDRGGSDET